jgi:hypothetical protein
MTNVDIGLFFTISPEALSVLNGWAYDAQTAATARWWHFFRRGIEHGAGGAI